MKSGRANVARNLLRCNRQRLGRRRRARNRRHILNLEVAGAPAIRTCTAGAREGPCARAADTLKKLNQPDQAWCGGHTDQDSASPTVTTLLLACEQLPQSQFYCNAFAQIMSRRADQLQGSSATALIQIRTCRMNMKFARLGQANDAAQSPRCTDNAHQQHEQQHSRSASQCRVIETNAKLDANEMS